MNSGIENLSEDEKTGGSISCDKSNAFRNYLNYVNHNINSIELFTFFLCLAYYKTFTVKFDSTFPENKELVASEFSCSWVCKDENTGSNFQ